MPFLIALQFLTIIPITLKKMPNERQIAYSVLFYPVIGLLIGAILFFIATLFSALPIILTSALILTTWILLTGGLHLDGLADTADAWIGGLGNQEKTLKIMKDPTCGPIGVLSLVLTCLLKFSGIYVLLEVQQHHILLMIPLLGRLCTLFFFITTPYVRKNGLGHILAQHLPRTLTKTVLIIGIFTALLFGKIGFITACITLIIWLQLRRMMLKRIDGMTGDTLGASIEITETSSLIVFLLLFSLIFTPL